MEKVGVLLLVLATASASLMLQDLMRERRDVEQHTLTIRDLTKRSPEPHPESLHLEIRTADGETENLILKRNPHFNDDVLVETSHQGVRKRHVTDPLNVAEYLSKRAAFHVKSEWAEDRYKRSFTGFLYKRSGNYLVERAVNGGHSMVKLETPPLAKPEMQVGQVLYDALEPPDNRAAFTGGKTFSKGKNLRPDVLLVLDNSVYKKMSEKFRDLSSSRREQATIQRIKEFYGVVWAGVAQKYEQVNYRGMTIAPRAAQILILKTASDDRDVVGDNRDGNNLFANGALKNAAHWFQDERRRGKYPDIDHNMVFTNNRMYSKDDQGKRSFSVVGLAYVGQVCEYWASSIIEDNFSMQAIGTAAHELGHNLGAGHDNDRACQDDYQMSPWVTDGNDQNFRNQYKFSRCSLEDFFKDMEDLNKFSENCMTDRPRIGREVEDLQNVVPGQRITRDQQCEILTGEEGATYCGPTEGVCRKLKCEVRGSCFARNQRHALHGTPCGRGMQCKNGSCQRV